MASRTPRSNLQSRDPFSGDCDGDTNVPERHPSTKRLAELRPVLRGLRREIARPRLPNQNLASCRAETRSQGIATQRIRQRVDQPELDLAEPRPVLRGLRPSGLEAIQALISYLAEPRPVLRGLRREARTARSSTPGRQACRAETRSQGIATLRRRQECWQLADKPCRAETRSQGIATWDSAGLGSRSRRSSPLAEPRPVLRGLRLTRPVDNYGCHTDLQSRDPFSGDCDNTCPTSIHPPAGHSTILQSRDPFSGDCDASAFAEIRRAMDQLILQSRDPFSGDCDSPPGPSGGGASRFEACRAETRSQGIATGRLCLVGQSDPDHRLQSRDPFSGDCDSPPT